MSDNIFNGLPPPSAPPPPPDQKPPQKSNAKESHQQNSPPPPALKSALKRSKPQASQPEGEAAAPEKRLRFKTSTDATDTQIIEAMKKIASHIQNLSKFKKASKLAIQLIEAGSVKPATRDHFFAILETAMSSPINCNDPSVRTVFYQEAARGVDYMVNQGSLDEYLFTDDSFVFSKACTKIRDTISNLPVATADEDTEEAAALTDKVEVTKVDSRTGHEIPSVSLSELVNKEESDPFGLDAFLPSALKKDENMKGEEDAVAARIRKEEQEETKRLLKSEREALIMCLETSARRCQTVIDITVKHAFDNVSRFTAKQRDAVEKLWASIREQQTRRKQGKSVTGKLDMSAFEWLQEKYSNEKISIRHSVGGTSRRAEQWLG